MLVEREERVHLGPARHGGEHAFGDLGKDASALAKTSRSAAVERADSRPPLRIAALPDLSASDPICVTASGRDSKTTRRTPRGQVTFSRTRPSSRSVRESDAAGRVGQRRRRHERRRPCPAASTSSSVRRSKADARRGVLLRRWCGRPRTSAPVRLEDGVACRVDPVGHLSKDLPSVSDRQRRRARRAATRACAASSRASLFAF